MADNKGTGSYIQVRQNDWENLNRALRYLYDQVDGLSGRRGNIPLGSDLDLNDHKGINAADPTASQDLVNLEYADAHYGPTAIQAALSITGSAPLNVSSLPGVLGESQPAIIVESTHADRFVNNLPGKFPVDSILYETDRMLFYRNTANGAGIQDWTYLMGTWRALHSARPGGAVSGATNATPIVVTTTGNHNLVTGDRVSIFGVATNTNANGEHTVRVTGATTFELNGTTGNGAYGGGGQVCGFGLADEGLLFEETDRGPSTYRVTFISAHTRFVLQPHLSFPLSTNQATLPTDLNTLGDSSTFFRVDVVDFVHILTWSGSGWAFDDSDDGSFYFIEAPGVPQGGLWQELDGSTVTYLKADGTTGSFTTPDEITAPSGVFHKSIAAYTGTINAASAGTLSGTTGSTTATNQATTATNQTTDLSPTTAKFAADAGGTNAVTGFTNPHGHTQDAHNHIQDAHTHSAGTLAVSTAGQPRNLGVRRFFRR